MSKRRRTLTTLVHSVLFALICIFCGQTEMAAQEPLQPGTRVRVTAPDCGLRGQATRLEALRADTLVLDTSECPLASVTRLDVSRGRKSNGRKGAGIGFLTGAVTGVLLDFRLVTTHHSSAATSPWCLPRIRRP